MGAEIWDRGFHRARSTRAAALQHATQRANRPLPHPSPPTPHPNTTNQAGYPCLSLHGGKDQSDRECTVADFKVTRCGGGGWDWAVLCLWGGGEYGRAARKRRPFPRLNAPRRAARKPAPRNDPSSSPEQQLTPPSTFPNLNFKAGVGNVLVATSVAARGLDVRDLVLVSVVTRGDEWGGGGDE